jgi:hypothetical protein
VKALLEALQMSVVDKNKSFKKLNDITARAGAAAVSEGTAGSAAGETVLSQQTTNSNSPLKSKCLQGMMDSTSLDS